LLEEYLGQLDLHSVAPADRAKFLEYMVIRAFYDKVVDALECYGYGKIAVNRLVKLCSGWMAAEKSDNRNEFILDLCHYVFRKGKFDETVLQYLIRYYYGPTSEMFSIWQAAKGFDLETHLLEERLICQMLFAESYVQDSFLIFSEYYKEVTNHLLVKAYLTLYAYKYLVHGRIINAELFPIMRREQNYEENDICLLAWLKFNVSNPKLNENDLKFIEYSIFRLEKKGIVLPFFADYGKLIRLPERIIDKSYVEYKTDPRKQVYIHYRLLKENAPEEYITERMPNVFLGIHVKEFVLFYHEILQYYITEEFDDEVNITESLQLHFDQETVEEEESNYSQINLMLIAMEMKDEKTLLDIMEHYIRTQYTVTKCFEPIE
jgi:hypothetical protein